VAKLYSYWITVNYREAYGLYACNGILFNHESPRRGETFVTRKITRGARQHRSRPRALPLRWQHGRAPRLGAREGLRAHAVDDAAAGGAEDFVIATGEQHSVRDFIRWSAAELGIELEFEGQGEDEAARVKSVTSNLAPAVEEGDVIVRVDPRYFRPAEVETLLGDSSRAKEKLGWEPQITAREMCAEMVEEDLKIARRHALLKEHGLDLPVSHET
jgi:GDPmannose 4,6-dehydratase